MADLFVITAKKQGTLPQCIASVCISQDQTLTTTPMTWCTTCNMEHFTDHVCSSLLIQPETVDTLVAILEEDAILKWNINTDMVELITVCDYFLIHIDLIKTPLMRSITRLHCQFPEHFKVPELYYSTYFPQATTSLWDPTHDQLQLVKLPGLTNWYSILSNQSWTDPSYTSAFLIMKCTNYCVL